MFIFVKLRRISCYNSMLNCLFINDISFVFTCSYHLGLMWLLLGSAKAGGFCNTLMFLMENKIILTKRLE